MRFKEFDSKMRVFEEEHDRIIPAGTWMAARIDGRNFTKLTKDGDNFDRPFDERFHDAMVAVLGHLMDCGFKTIFGFTQSDEISVLISKYDETFERKERKLNSILAAEAASIFSIATGEPAAFDCRISQLPDNADVVDYFRWRRSDCVRNTRNAYVYWGLRDKHGYSGKKADAAARAMGHEGKAVWLVSNGIQIDTLPEWQTHGYAAAWLSEGFVGIDPRDGSEHEVLRNRLTNMPTRVHGETYGSMIESLLRREEAGH